MTNPDCFHWEDTNELEPPSNVDLVGMWIDSDGTTSTEIVRWNTPGNPLRWDWDDQPIRDPHVWCANLDAHQPPRTGETQPVKTPPKTPLWVNATAGMVTVGTGLVIGVALGMGLGAALANSNPTLGTVLVMLIIAGAWAPTVVAWRRRRKEGTRGV